MTGRQQKNYLMKLSVLTIIEYMKYIIMADGKGTRWQNYNDIPKHFIEIEGETLLHRTVRLVLMSNSEEGNCDYSELKRESRFESRNVGKRDEIIITSHDPRYEIEGARRYEPLNNVLEVDRFTEELIEDDICFLYGDTYYSEEAMKTIMETEAEDVLFFGNQKSIVAVKIKDGELFKSHVDRVRELFKSGEISRCKGWQVYRSFVGLPVGSDNYKERGPKFITVDSSTEDFNSPEDLTKAGIIEIK